MVGGEVFLKLVSLDYDSDSDLVEAKRIVAELFPRVFACPILAVQVRFIATGMLSRTISLEDGCRMLAELREDDGKSIPIIFVGYASEIDRVGLSYYKDRILDDTRLLLEDIDIRYPCAAGASEL